MNLLLKINRSCVRVFIFAGLLVSIAGCTYQAAAVRTAAPAAEIRVDRVRDHAVALYIDEESQELTSDARVIGITCSAHTFPLEMGPAVRQSIRSVLEGGFQGIQTITQTSAIPEGAPLFFRFTLEEFDPTVSFAANFWNSTATANVDIVMGVVASGIDGEELLRLTIAGDGTANSNGGCGEGATVLAEAGEEAIEELLENFVFRVINSDELDQEISDNTT